MKLYLVRAFADMGQGSVQSGATINLADNEDEATGMAYNKMKKDFPTAISYSVEAHHISEQQIAY